MSRVFLLFAALMACGPVATMAPECDADCRVEKAVEAWARSTPEGAAAMAKLTDPMERMLVARRVMENGHIQGGEVCAFVENPSTRDYCMRLSHRPHLFEAPRPKRARRTRAAGGPVDAELLPTRSVPTPAADMAAAELVGCLQEEDTAACADRLALEAARQKRLQEIAGLCNAVAAPRLRSECRFAAAEEAVRFGGARAVEGAVPLCLAAGEYVAHCLGHMATRIADRAPAADGAERSWSPVLAGAQALEVALMPLDATLATSAADRVYAEAAAIAYSKAGTLDGRPFDALPERAAPAVRSSLAWELVKRGGLKTASSLDAAVKLLGEAEEARGAKGTPVAAPARVIVRNRWGVDDPSSSAFAAVWWRGPARRPHDPSVEVDRALAILEAVADVRGAHDPMLEAAMGHSVPVIAWSSARLTGRPGRPSGAQR